MNMLNAFKIVYVLFILLVAFIFSQNGDKNMLMMYLMMGSFALLATLLHVCLTKIQHIEQQLLSSKADNQ